MLVANRLRKCNRLVGFRSTDAEFRLGRSSLLNKQTYLSASSQRAYISVPEFFKDKTVFITGATGFVGQGLVEKMLRSCPDVKQIILPIRESRKGSVEDRFTEYLKLPVFEKLSKLNPRFHEKLVPSQVDIGRSDLGLQKDIYDKFTKTVDIIIHAAANTKINAPLNEVIHDNVLGTDNVLNFAKQCDNLKVLVFVSTAFSNTHLDYMKEEVLQEDFVTPNMLNQASVPGHEKMIDLRGSVFTYIFSKRITEQIVAEKQGNFPVVILRPSMITAAYAEPFPAWSSGKLAYNGIIHMLADKTLPYIPGYPEVEIEMVPVDFVINTIITSAWMLGTGQRFNPCHKGPLVINLHSTNQNKISNESFVDIVNDHYQSVENTPYRTRLLQNLILFEVLYLCRCLPTCLVRDIKEQIEGRNGRNTRRLLVQIKQIKVLSLFSFKNIKREYNHCDQLASQLSKADRKTFNTDIRDIEWKSYIHGWLEISKRKQ